MKLSVSPLEKDERELKDKVVINPETNARSFNYNFQKALLK